MFKLGLEEHTTYLPWLLFGDEGEEGWRGSGESANLIMKISCTIEFYKDDLTSSQLMDWRWSWNQQRPNIG